MMHKGVNFLLTSFLCLGCLFAACNPVPPQAAAVTPSRPPSTVEPVVLKVGIQQYMSNTVLKIAEQEGYFTEQGIKAELVDVRSSSDLITLALRGDLDTATPALNAGLFNAIAGGGNVKIILSLTHFEKRDCAPTGVLMRKSDLDSGKYADPANWKGARIMLGQSGLPGINGYYLSRILAPTRLSLDDFQVENMDPPIQEEALRNGKVDIVFTTEPWITRMTQKGDISLFASVDKYAPGLSVSVVIAGPKLLNNPDLGVRFSTAYLKAVRQYLKGPTPRNVEIAAAFTALEPELVKKICWSYSPPDGRINARTIIEYQEWMKSRGLMDAVVPVEKFSEPGFAEKANKLLEAEKK